MDFYEYKWKHRLSYQKMSKELGCSTNHLNQIALKKWPPGRSLALLIENYTKGEVKAEDLLDRTQYRICKEYLPLEKAP